MMSHLPNSCTFGNFVAEIPESQEYLTLNFSPTSPPRQKRWKNYGLSADFLGDYFATFFPGEARTDSKLDRKSVIKGTVSYIANELLENAMKYSEKAANLPISITLYLYEQEIIFQVINYASVKTAEEYQQFVRDLLADDFEVFYTRQLEKTALGLSQSSMGILTLINDYGVVLGWRFQPLEQNPEVVRVQVHARLQV
jgi:hypothetical protein